MACSVCGGSWRRLTGRQAGSVPLGRSSHSVVPLEGYKVAVFGGEHEPRHPIDNAVHVLDVASAHWTRLETSPDHPAPSARVGQAAASVGNRFYMFGGRTGVDQEETSLGDMWEFDAATTRWRQIEAEGAPAARSYHVMASHAQHVYVFGGCAASGREEEDGEDDDNNNNNGGDVRNEDLTVDGGRLGGENRQNDLFTFDTEKQAWEKLEHTGTASEQPSVRGGPALFATADKVYVFGGFSGKEMDDFWAYDLNGRKWEAVQAQGDRPTARSVVACATLGHHLFLFGGEVDPSIHSQIIERTNNDRPAAQGHAGAGDYSNETFIFDTNTRTWLKKDGASEETPTPRGWLAGAGLQDEQFLLFGGFDGKERTGDLFLYSSTAQQ